MLDGTEFFECACGSDEHTLRFTLSLDDDEPELYTHVYLRNWQGFWKRCWIALKYVCGYTSKYGHWDCFIMRPEDAARLSTLCTRLSAFTNDRAGESK